MADYFKVSCGKSPSVTYESYSYFDLAQGKRVTMARQINSETTTTVEEARGLSEEDGIAEGEKATSVSGSSDDYTVVSYSAARSNEANAWLATRTTSRTKVTKTPWAEEQ